MAETSGLVQGREPGVVDPEALRAEGRLLTQELGRDLCRQVVLDRKRAPVIDPGRRLALGKIGRELMRAGHAASNPLNPGSAVTVTVGVKYGLPGVLEIGPAFALRGGRERGGATTVDASVGLGVSVPFVYGGYSTGIKHTAGEPPTAHGGAKWGAAAGYLYATSRDPVLHTRTLGFYIPGLLSAGVADDGSAGLMLCVPIWVTGLFGSFGVFVRHRSLRTLIGGVFTAYDAACRVVEPAIDAVSRAAREVGAFFSDLAAATRPSPAPSPDAGDAPGAPLRPYPGPLLPAAAGSR